MFNACFSVQDSKFSYAPPGHVYAWFYVGNVDKNTAVLYHILPGDGVVVYTCCGSFSHTEGTQMHLKSFVPLNRNRMLDLEFLV